MPIDNPDSKPLAAKEIARIADECRLDILPMIERAGSGHPGGSLSIVEIVTTLFYREILMDPQKPDWEDRDRFILSKGHGVPALYAVLARKGAIPKEELATFRQIGSRLQGHPDRALLPFVEASTGSLGQGLSIAQGIALGLKLRRKTARVFCVLGDGELQEGQVWEAAMSAPKFKLNNLVAFVDLNNGQIDGRVQDVMDLRPLADKWRSFRWVVHEVDGHRVEDICSALDRARAETERPTMILARTVKGKGVSFMENDIDWHGVAPTKEQLDRALVEIRNRLRGTT